MPLSALENHVFPMFILYSAKAQISPIGAEGLSFGQTF